MAWDRETPWRQGSVLPPEALGPLGLSHPEDPENTIAVVISHDCDLANDDLGLEPHVEVIVGRCIEVASGDITNAKVPRRLHLTFTSKSESLVVELLATAKVLVQKENLALFQPDAWGLSESEHSVLQRWLGARYRRAAFPDAFESVLKGAKLHTRIAKILDPLGYAISAIFFDVQESEGLYSLGILLLYDTGSDPERAEC